MIPIGRASIAGKLTFKSTTTISAKEGISMGSGAQKITTDVTGNSKIKSKKQQCLTTIHCCFFYFMVPVSTEIG